MEILEGIPTGSQAPRRPSFDPVAVVDEFASSVKNGLDFMHEGTPTPSARLEEGEEAWFPIVYWDLTTRASALRRDQGHQSLHWR